MGTPQSPFLPSPNPPQGPAGAPAGQPPASVACTGVPRLGVGCAQLASTVGPPTGAKAGQQWNLPVDVTLIQKLINMIVNDGYVENSVLGGGNGKLAVPLLVNGVWSPALNSAIVQIERLYFHGRANPHGLGVIDPQADESMFTFLVAIANGSQKAKQQLSVQMHALAAAMVPAGKVLIDVGGKAPDGTTVARKESAINVYLPILLDALTQDNLNDTDMVLVALATIRAETTNFVPRAESEYDLNTTGTYTNNATGDTTYTSTVDNVHGKGYGTLLQHHGLQTKKVHQETWTPNAAGTKGDIYDGGNGNNQPGDGWKYRGRGLIQLTGKGHYVEAGTKTHTGDLFLNDPDQINSQQYAGLVVAGYLSASEKVIRAALKNNNLNAVRRAVNGATNGIDDFKASWKAGTAVIAMAVIEEAKVVTRHRRPPHKRKKKA